MRIKRSRYNTTFKVPLNKICYKSVEEIFAKSNINLSYIPIKDKLYGIYEKFNIAKVGKEPWQKIEERQKKIQRKYYGALKNFIDKYNVLFKIMLAWQK